MSFFKPSTPLFDPRMALYDGVYDPSLVYSQPANTGIMNPFGGGYATMTPPLGSGPGARRQLNWLAIFSAIFVPFGLFVGTFSTMAFDLYYRHPLTALMVIAGCFFFTLIVGAFWAQAKRREIGRGMALGRDLREETWHYFICTTSVVACILGSALGLLTMICYTTHYYDYIGLRKAVDVSPGQWHGGQILDAGEIHFQAGSHVDASMRSMWQHGTRYCAAPIVPADGAKLASYDFWAVGMECCEGAKAGPHDPSFTCGDEGATSGLRVMEADEIEGYALAVQQAAAAHEIEARHPIFLYMLQQPFTKIKSYMDEAMSILIFGGACHLIGQTMLVAVQAYEYGKHEPSGYLKDEIGGHHKRMYLPAGLGH